MKKRNLKKMHLAKETLRSMLDSELSEIVGGLRSAANTCPARCPSTDYLNAPEGIDTFSG
jgi:hypothetical protein